MFTQATPAIINSLRDANGPWPMVRALGNCQAPLTHRGAVNFAPAPNKTRTGVYGPGAWNPADYPGLVPNAGNVDGTDIGGMKSTWNAGNAYNSQFFFPTDQYFTQNQFFGGPTFNVQCNANIDYITNQSLKGNEISAKKIKADELNDEPLVPLAGPAGADGADGRPGAPGALFLFNFFQNFQRGIFARIRFLQVEDRKRLGIKYEAEPVAKPHRYVSDGWVRPTSSFSVPTNAISGGTVTVTPTAASASIPTGVTFNPDTCSVTFSAYTTIYFAASGAVTASLSGTAAAAVSIKAVAATESGSTLASSVAAGTGVLIDLKHADTEKIKVCRDPELVGFVERSAEVLHAIRRARGA